MGLVMVIAGKWSLFIFFDEWDRLWNSNYFFCMKKRSSKSIYDFNRVDSIVSAVSSHRSDSLKDETHQVEEEGNFHRQEMKNIHQNIFIRKVIRQLQSLIARNQTPKDMAEEWEAKEENEDIQATFENQTLDDKINKRYPWMRVLCVLQGVLLLIFLWSISIAVVYQQKIFPTLFSVIAAAEILFTLSASLLVSIDEELSCEDTSAKLKKLSSPFLMFATCVLMLTKQQIDINFLAIVIDVWATVVSVFLFRELSQYFKTIKIYAENKKLIKELRIIELFCMLLCIAHVFGLIIYSSIYMKPEGEPTWLLSTDRSLQFKPWHSRYIYSLYWAITTIVTVGFGDLTPQNEAEVIVIMVLQILGTSFFGYMINVIGITVDNINKKNQEYDNYQETISKLKDHYQLSDELCSDMKKDIEKKYNQEHQTVSLKKNEENDFLDYVDSTVKKNFILQTNIRIIKKSIFFLTYFTVSFQNYVALKLIRTIYKKDQNIETYDPISRQRNIVIINHGKANLYIEKRQNNIVKNKLVRTIQPIEGKPTLNVIGYSSLILNQNIDLFASASEMTSGYILKMSDVLECIDKSMIDYESFHEMREKMLLFLFKEAIEAPSLKDPSLHFAPNIFILVCRHSKQSQHKRKKTDRLRKRGFLLLDKVKTQLSKDWYTVNHEDSVSFSEEEINNKVDKKMDDFESLLSIEEPEEQVGRAKMAEGDKSGPEDKHLCIDQVKIFQHFMKNHNINIVAANYEKACNVKSYKNRIQSCFIKKQRQSQALLESRGPKKLKRQKHSFNRVSRQIAPIRL